MNAPVKNRTAQQRTPRRSTRTKRPVGVYQHQRQHDPVDVERNVKRECRTGRVAATEQPSKLRSDAQDRKQTQRREQQYRQHREPAAPALPPARGRTRTAGANRGHPAETAA
jgi:hypothetical protein